MKSVPQPGPATAWGPVFSPKVSPTAPLPDPSGTLQLALPPALDSVSPASAHPPFCFGSFLPPGFMISDICTVFFFVKVERISRIAILHIENSKISFICPNVISDSISFFDFGAN